jgi:hypothetical protein
MEALNAVINNNTSLTPDELFTVGKRSTVRSISILCFCFALLFVGQAHAACNIEKYPYGSELEKVTEDLFTQFPMGHGIERYLLLDGKEACPQDDRLWGVPITLVFVHDQLVQYQILHPVDKPQLNGWLEESYGVKFGVMPGLTAALPNAQKAWDLGDVTVFYSVIPRPGEIIEYIAITSTKHASLLIKRNTESEKQ